MRSFYSTVLLTLTAVGCFNRVQVGPVSFPIDQPKPVPTMDFFDLSATDINGDLIKLDRYKGMKVMVVNTASECGFTPQYKQLQELYETYKDKGLVILGFPCNDFGGQEPGTGDEIEAFCQKNYGVTFPLMAKVSIKGDAPHPVYRWLTNKSENGVMDASVKWNFHKFLIDEQGHLVKALGSGIEPFDEEVVGWLKS